ncbi:GNAT family N-acetyltransferase [Chitinimonas naiadis]
MSAGLQLRRASPRLPEAIALIDALDVYQRALYPAESNHLLDIATLDQPSVSFHLAYVDGEAVGCGAVVSQSGYAELKRMYVVPAARGQGRARALLAALEQAAIAQGHTLLQLETGIHQPEAIGLYRRAGYTDCLPFGDYQPDPLSLFMQKTL